MSYDNHDYSALYELTGISTIESTHQVGDILFVAKILLEESYSDLLSENFVLRNVPYNLRVLRPIEEESSNCDLLLHSPLFRLRREWNSLSQEIRDSDGFDCFKAEVKKEILRYSD